MIDMRRPTKKNGFTLPELIIAVSFFAILLTLVTINLLGSRKQIAQGANIDVMVADIKAQQAKSMGGEGTSVPSDYGVYLESDKYTLFTGDTYSAGNSTNFAIGLDPAVTLNNILFPNSVIVFSKGSGEVANFSSGQNAFSVNSKTVTINKYGAITLP